MPLFEPEHVAVLGATDREGSLGRAILENLFDRFEGEIIPINPGRDRVLGRSCVDSVADVEGPIDLAIVAIPPDAVLDALEELGRREVRHVVVLTAGFGEGSAAGQARERRLDAIAEQYDLNVVGPNSLGVMSTASGLNATFAEQWAHAGPISMLSQSGAFVTAALDWAWDRDVGFRHVVSLGNEAVLDEIDFVRHWHRDPNTTVIAGYVEDVKRGHAFIDTVGEITDEQPVVLLKAGRTESGARAAASHTGSMTGRDEAYDAAFRQAGVIRAATMDELFDFSRVLASLQPPAGDAIAIVTNAGGPGVLAADAVSDADLELAALSASTIDRLAEYLPDAATVGNPLDIIGDADVERFVRSIELVTEDPGVDGLIIIATPTALFDHADLGDRIGEIHARTPLPIVGCLLGGQAATAGGRALAAHEIPNFTDPARAVGGMDVLARYRRIRDRESDAPVFPDDVEMDRVRDVFRRALDRDLRLLGAESMDLLEAIGVPMPACEVVTDAAAAERAAADLGDDVVMKIVSPDMSHKTDIGGVRLGVPVDEAGAVYDELTALAEDHDPDAELLGVQVQELVGGSDGVETIVGASRDEQFGPLLVFGLGGVFVEVFEDTAFRIAPVGTASARRMTAEIEAAPLLRGARGREPVDLDGVVDVITRISWLVDAVPGIVELDVNPLLARPDGPIALDFRLAIEPDEVGEWMDDG